MDSVVLSWLLSTISIDLQETTCARDRTAQQLWVALEEQFLGNHKACALHLDTQFRLFIQGDLRVDDYCRRMKGMAEPFPSFHDVRNDLLLEELTLDAKASSGSATALAASGGQQ
jgi:hypothetical protein